MALGGVVLGADEVVAAFFGDDTHGVLFVVEGIGGDERVFESDLRIGSPVGGFVNGTVVAFRITETLGEQGPVTMLATPCGAESTHGQTEALGGEVGPATCFKHQKTAQLHDEFESL